MISRLKRLLRPPKNEPKNPKILIGRNVGHQETTIHDHVSIGDNCYLYRCHINSFTYLSSYVSMMNTTVGKFCSIAQGTSISLGMHPASKFVSTSPAFFSIHQQCGITFADQNYFEEMGKTSIGNDVWIGANAIVKDNITIGDGAIVGAGAIVTKDIPDYAIVVGNPARILRYRFNEEQIAFLKEFKWWFKEEEWLRENFKDLHDIESFMKKYKS